MIKRDASYMKDSRNVAISCKVTSTFLLFSFCIENSSCFRNYIHFEL